jgi:hypothetical protein
MILLAMALNANADMTDVQPYTVTANLTVASQYMTDGFNVGGDHPVWQPSLNLTTPLDGVSVSFWSSLQIDRDNQQYDELDFMALYSHDFMKNTSWAFNLHGYYDYWTYPKININDPSQFGPDSEQNMHGNKLHAGASMTNLIPLWGSHLVPTYNVYYWLYWAENRQDLFRGGARHELMLSYYHDIPKVISGAQELYAGVSESVNYNDGAFGVQPAWSHSVLQLSTGVYSQGWNFALSVDRQWSYEPSVDPNDELWSMVSFTKQF